MINWKLLKNPKPSINEQITINIITMTWLNVQGTLFPWLTKELGVLTKKQYIFPGMKAK
jgi:hypothetical protein